MTKYLSAADTAKLVRQALKAALPGVKFSVRSDTYSGGASIRVGWTDGPFEQAVADVVQRYRGADFDGMQDLKIHRDSTLIATPDGTVEDVHFGADYIFTERKLSDAYLAELEPHAAAILDDYAGTYQQGFQRDSWYEGVPSDYGVFQQGNGHSLLWYLSRHIAPGAPAPTPRVRAAVRGETTIRATEPVAEEKAAPIPGAVTARQAAELIAELTAPPEPQFFCDKVMRVMADEEPPDATVGMFLLAARGYLIARDAAPFDFDAHRGYMSALRILLAVDAGLPDADEKIQATISEALSYWTRRGYR
jgi:hypothetical protein